MFKSLIAFTTLICIITSFSLLADCCCCQSADVSVGWRRDSLDWETSRLHSSYIDGRAKSDILFKDINSYTISGTAKWAGTFFYVRLSGEYGLTDKGRAHERFRINSPYYLYDPIEVHTNDKIKRRSEVYDFNGAVGYPLSFCCCRFSAIPLIGFSFHRQHLRVKGDKRCCHSSHSSSSSSDSYSDYSSSSSCSFCSSYCDFCSSSSSSSFCVCSSNPFISSQCSNPFSSRSDPNIAHDLGLCTRHRTSNYRFTWYGFYIGADLAYALDSCWTLFSELEYHFLDRCHRKRKSWTGVDFVDDYHKSGWAHGFNGVVGVTYAFSTCWYTTLGVDFRWWKADSRHDDLEWKMVGAKIGVGYMF